MQTELCNSSRSLFVKPMAKKFLKHLYNAARLVLEYAVQHLPPREDLSTHSPFMMAKVPQHMTAAENATFWASPKA